MADVKAEDHGSSESMATFKGRLQLNNFMYRASEPPASLRRSPRLSVSPAKPAITDLPAPPPPVSASPTPKRKSAPASPAPSRKKRSRTSSGYAPPSKYAHLEGIPDAVAPNLLVFFVGLNPGIQTAVTGHAYAHPSNLFWKLLYSSGVTPRACRADEDRQMPELYSLGLTNIVSRPSRNGAELSKQEMDEGVAALEDKARRWRPECMCIVGKSIWESVWRVRHGANVGKAFKYGWQDEGENMGVVPGEWAGAKVFVASSTSGLAATLSPAEKQRIWDELGTWVKARRAEREKQGGDPQNGTIREEEEEEETSSQ
ncbi:G/U mismatch-specific uracil DNA glycosylase [Paramyrothecium foliicola]|nr:G/U mismatch-specific uracil DNA glycosylase [Paramyrothecium foliicola]